MKKSAASKTLLFTAISVGALCAGAWRAEAQYVQTNLVSDIPGLATITDPSLVNPWGVSFMGASPFWVSNQGANTSTLYAVTGSTTVTKAPLTVAIPTTASGPQGPTGQVANTNFVILHTRGRHTRFLHLRQSERHDFGLESRQWHGSYYPGDRPDLTA